MTTSISSQISSVLSITESQIKATISLLDEGATVPFIARYRKERTGSLDEVQITSIRDEYQRLTELQKRRDFILKSIKEQGKLTPQLEIKIKQATSLSGLEDIYLPYKPKRRTKATVAKEKGLEPLAKIIFDQNSKHPEQEANNYISKEKEVASTEEAIQGAKDIIAEWVSEDAEAREELRKVFTQTATLSSKLMRGKEQQGEKYKDYFEWSEPLKKAPSHRILAIRRAEKEGILSMDISPDSESAVFKMKKHFLKGYGPCQELVKEAIEDSFKRLLKPSIETEFRLGSKKKAEEEAITVFADNLRELLLASPLGQKSMLAIDPGFRTGCKVVALDKQGKLLQNTAIYPHEPQRKSHEAEATIQDLVSKHKLEAIAIGNGTAGRETESLVRKMSFSHPVEIVVVNESGASIYSASEVAREEFPDHDITVRGAVSIGRRLADPLAELVKIDPKSIGVGQYQHDVDQTALKQSLDDVVMSCVNQVGVELNTASKQLLTYVSGLGPVLAENIISHRNKNGAFSSRKELLDVPRMGQKAFEQAGGFLRIAGSSNPLDKSAVHPERYKLVKQMAKDLGTTVDQLMGETAKHLDLKKYITDEVGMPTLIDIQKELQQPGRDPRSGFEAFSFAEGVEDIKDLRVGMTLPGLVTNVTKFGAFVDIGVHQDGLVHISQLANKFVSDPSDIVKVQQKVQVRVTEVDVQRKRIALSMKDEESKPRPKKAISKGPEKKVNYQDKMSQLKGKFGQ